MPDLKRGLDELRAGYIDRLEYVLNAQMGEIDRLRAEVKRRDQELRCFRELGSNRHPVDVLADLRAQSKRIFESEEEVRGKILRGECGLEGNDYVAIVQVQPVNRVDLRALRKYLGDDLKPFLNAKEVTQVWVKLRTEARRELKQGIQDEDVGADDE
jgi:hypothetical protein